MKKQVTLMIMVVLAAVIVVPAVGGEADQEPVEVRLGNEVFLEKNLDWVKGKRVGLITNPSGINKDLVSTVDVLMNHPGINLVALFGPEHGVRGDFTAGEKVGNATDEVTGLPMYSLYGDTQTPTAEMLENIDILIFDIQDIGYRAYTYIWTMARAMEACAEYGKEFVVFDRPNPLGGKVVEGNPLDMNFSSGVGYLPTAYRHGMTIGELALLFKSGDLAAFSEEPLPNMDCKLRVFQMKNWKREMTFKETGLPWVGTSTHVQEPDTPSYACVTGILGELIFGINNGVGYTLPFKLVGAPWVIKAQELTGYLNAKQLPGVRFSPAYYKPYYTYFKGKQCQGVRIHIDETAKKTRFCAVGFHIMAALRDLYPDHFNFELPENVKRIGMFDKVCGTDGLRKDFTAGLPPEEIITNWEDNLEQFLRIREKYLLY